MQAKPSIAAAPLPYSPVQTGQTLVAAQKNAIVMAGKLGGLAFKYALEINKIGFELWQRQLQNFSGLSGKLAPRPTPRQAVVAHAERIEKATQDYEAGVKRVAKAGTQMARKSAQTLDKGRKPAEVIVKETASRAPKAAGRARPNAKRTRAAR